MGDCLAALRHNENVTALEARRLRAAELFAAGVRQAEVARQLEVSAQGVIVWHARWQQGGTDAALRSRGPNGPVPRLYDQQLATIEQALLEGAGAQGFTGELWTLGRIALVIERRTGVRQPERHRLNQGEGADELLGVADEPPAGDSSRLGVGAGGHRLGWSVQRPRRPAAERNEAAIDHWVTERWPQMLQTPNNAQRRRACLVLFDESALSLTPKVRRTWAARGQPDPDPLVQLEEGLDGGCSLRWRRWRWRWRPTLLPRYRGQRRHRDPHRVPELHWFLGGEKATLVWDGLAADRGRAMRAWLNRQRSWLVSSGCPPLRRSANPTEGLWSSLKAVELANHCCADSGPGYPAGASRHRAGAPDAAFGLLVLRHAGLSVS